MMRFALILIGLMGWASGVNAQQVNVALVPVHSSANEDNHLLKASPGRLYQLSVSNATSTAGFIMVLDAAAVPSTGTVAPILCRALPASGTVVIDFIPTPAAQFTSGIVAVASSASVCTTWTTGTITAFFDAMLQ